MQGKDKPNYNQPAAAAKIDDGDEDYDAPWVLILLLLLEK